MRAPENPTSLDGTVSERGHGIKGLLDPDTILKNLDRAINTIITDKDSYVNNPGRDFTRNRKMPLRNVVEQILSFQKLNLIRELSDYGHIKDIDITASGFVQQRKKIRPELFGGIFREFNRQSSDPKTYCGYRLYAIDGTDLNTAYDKSADSYIDSGDYNQLSLNLLFDLANTVYTDCIIQPRPKKDERKALTEMMERSAYSEKSIIIADRGYESYNVFKHFIDRTDVDCVIRVRNEVLAPIKNMPMSEWDEEVEFTVTKTQTNSDKANRRIFILSKWDHESPCTIKMRFVRIMLEAGHYETIATTLDKDTFPASRIKELYFMRWGIETSFRNLKYTAGIINQLSKKRELVEQEIYASLTMFNFCSRIAASIAINKNAAKWGYKANFKAAFSACRKFFLGIMTALELMLEICKHLIPIKPDRQLARRMKPKSFVGFSYRVAA